MPHRPCHGCCGKLSCGYCNNKDLLTKNVPVTISGFSGIRTCACKSDFILASDVPGQGILACECITTIVADSATLNGTYLLAPLAGFPPPAGFAQQCWWHIAAPGTVSITRNCTSYNGFDCANFTFDTHYSAVNGVRDIWFGILHPPGGLQFQVMASFGLACGGRFNDTDCEKTITSFLSLWQTAVIPVDTVRGMDCLNITSPFIAVPDPSTVILTNKGPTFFDVQGTPSVP